MSPKAAAKFCYRLGTGLKAGADIVRSLESETTIGSARQREAMRHLVDQTKRGEALADAMELDPFFPSVMAVMTRVGESTGRIERALLTLAEHYEHRVQTQKLFLQSIAWPMLQLIAGILVLSLLILVMGILVPAGGGEMPDMLGFGLRGASGVLAFWFYLAIVFGAIALAIWGYSRNVAGVQNIVPLVYMVPKLGESIQTITISRFCWTLALTLEAGLDPIEAIRLALDSTDSDYYRGAGRDAENAIRGGSTLAGAIQATGAFPDDFIARVEVAEHSGTDAESMAHLAREYDERAKTAIRLLSGLATILIRGTVIIIFVFLIFRLASVYINAINAAGAPI